MRGLLISLAIFSALVDVGRAQVPPNCRLDRDMAGAPEIQCDDGSFAPLTRDRFGNLSGTFHPGPMSGRRLDDMFSIEIQPPLVRPPPQMWRIPRDHYECDGDDLTGLRCR